MDMMNVLFGKHPGFRAVHAKGIVCEGEFTPAPSASTLSSAPHLQAKPVHVTVRFSDSTGMPDIPDGAPFANPHGLAVRFHCPKGGAQISSPTPSTGSRLRTARTSWPSSRLVRDRTGCAKPTPIKKFLGTHPKAMRASLPQSRRR